MDVCVYTHVHMSTLFCLGNLAFVMKFMIPRMLWKFSQSPWDTMDLFSDKPSSIQQSSLEAWPS